MCFLHHILSGRDGAARAPSWFATYININRHLHVESCNLIQCRTQHTFLKRRYEDPPPNHPPPPHRLRPRLRPTNPTRLLPRRHLEPVQRPTEEPTCQQNHPYLQGQRSRHGRPLHHRCHHLQHRARWQEQHSRLSYRECRSWQYGQVPVDGLAERSSRSNINIPCGLQGGVQCIQRQQRQCMGEDRSSGIRCKPERPMGEQEIADDEQHLDSAVAEKHQARRVHSAVSHLPFVRRQSWY